MTENELATIIVDAAFKVHTRLGPGLFESVYESVLEYELAKRRLHVVRQVAMPVVYDSLKIDDAFRADMIVGGKVIIELKSLEKLAAVHSKQLNTYLRLSGLKLGLLINFGEVLIKDGITRIANHLED